MNELQRQGYLSPLRARTCGTLRRDLASVNVMRTGEYDERALAELMCRSLQLESAVKAFREYASDRKAAVAFCCTIQHAVLLRHQRGRSRFLQAVRGEPRDTQGF